MQSINIGKSEVKALSDAVSLQKPKEFSETRRIMADYAVMLTAVLIASYFNYGIRAFLLSLCSVLSCAVCRKIGEKILGTESSRDFSSIVIGMSAGLLLPVTAPLWMAVCAGTFAVAVCVLPFGSVRKSPFVPAAGAICFLTLCWSGEMFAYSSDNIPALTKMLMQNTSIGKNSVALMEILTGGIPSAVGAGSVIVLAGTLVFLAVRRPKSCVPVVTFMLSAGIMAFLFPRVSTGRGVSVIMELTSGMMLFCAVFFMSYPSVMPQRLISCALWGFAGGVICMLIRLFGAMEESVCFGILIIDAMTELFDRIPLTPWEKKRIRKSQPFIEISPIEVPQEVLNEIPDIRETDEAQEEPAEDITGEEETPEPPKAEDLDTVISEENTVNETQTAFIPGGDGDE